MCDPQIESLECERAQAQLRLTMSGLYLLPFHASLSSSDPLGIVEGGPAESSELIPQGVVLLTLLRRALAEVAQDSGVARKVFVSLLEDIAYTIHGNGSLNTTTLKTFLGSRVSPCEAERAISNIISAAIKLYQSETEQELRYLSRTYYFEHLQDSVAVSILAHAALGALNIPAGNTWGTPGFVSWYTDHPHHPEAVDGYLTMLFAFFQNLETDTAVHTIRSYYADDLPDLAVCDRIPDVAIDLVYEISELSSRTGTAIPFVLVAANKQPGPGPTGTQEERLQAASPWLLLCSLLVPVIPDNAAVITSAFPVLGQWTGHNRSARLIKLHKPHERPLRHYILADALPLDETEIVDGVLPDLSPGNVAREVKKLYAAFVGALSVSKQEGQSRCIIEAPPWGCGAFGGNFVVKMKCMMVAAGLAGVAVSVSATVDRSGDVELLRKLQVDRMTVADIWKSLSQNGGEM